MHSTTGVLVTYAADVGAGNTGAFAWARIADGEQHRVGEGREALDRLVDALIRDVETGHLVTLGWEAPLFVPVRADPQELNRARGQFERTRAFTASGGTGSLVTELVELAHLARRLPAPLRTLASDSPAEGVISVWEAFVSGADTPTPPCLEDVPHGLHGCDALVAEFAAHEALSGRTRPAWAEVIDATSVNWGPDAAVLDLVCAAASGTARTSVHEGWDVRLTRTRKPGHRTTA